ncbi:hypothetical protein DL96DRAFT_1821642 [Flagelloscypha sp. PMI_526]|nr:hypothetical protein DL96DRAFT_1821642 [Flagelloscypha sp. PMI_526]
MDPSQSKDLRSFFGTLVAHGHPRAVPRPNQSTLLPASKLDTGLNAAGTFFQLAKDVGDAASNVPYVKAVAGVLSQIIKIRDEIQANKERCDEIIDLVLSKTTIILQSLESVYRTNGADGFEDLKSDLESYSDFLQGVLRDELEPYKTQSKLKSYINRGKKSSDLQKIERQLNHFAELFSVKRQVAVSVDTRNTITLLSKPVPPAEVIPQALPACPEIVIGREAVVDNVVQAVLSSPKPRVALLGPGGIGKTTIGTTVLHDARITSAYPTKYFVSSELASTTELLEISIADALAIPHSSRGVGLLSQIVHSIHRNPNPILLYIDNLETVWEVESEQPKVDRFLEVLSGANSRLAILITMRGIQEPKTSFLWNPIIILGLDTMNSIAMFESLSHQPADASAHELLLKLSGSPLAIKLFALMVKEGDAPSHLLSSWNEHGDTVLEIGGKHRLSSLEQSIHLSVFSPRIDDTGRLVLGLIALMPDGLSTASPWFQGFESILPDEAPLQPTLRALRRMALLDKIGQPSRWQMLPPIRQFCLRLAGSTSPAVIALVELYIKTVIDHADSTAPPSHRIIVPEMSNIRSLLLHGAKLSPVLPSIGHASAYYANWAYWQDIDDSTIIMSFLHLAIPKAEKAHMYVSLGKPHMRWNRLGAAETSFAQALELYREVQDRRGEASTHRSFGELHRRRDQLDDAETSFAHALELYREIQSRLGQANTHHSIGDLQKHRNRLDAAEESFTHALELYREAQNRWGEANTHQSIGDLYQRQDRLDDAEVSLSLALELHREVQNRRGEANTHFSVGGLRRRRGRLGAAGVSFAHALEVYGEIRNRQGEASTHISIGDLHQRGNRLDASEASFSLALELYREIQNQLGEANALKSIGNLHQRRDRLDAAEVSFSLALELYREVQNRLGEANTHKSIGNIHERRDRLDAAEASFALASELFGELQDLWSIANCTLSQGRVRLRALDVNGASAAFSGALGLWNDIHDLWGIAQSHHAFGDLCLTSDRLGDAETSLYLALDMFTTQVESPLHEALVNRSIGELHLRREQFDDSERVFRRALELDILADSRVGQAQSNWGLGKMFMTKGDLGAAESSYFTALQLFFEIDDYQAAPCLLDFGKLWVLQGELEEDRGSDIEFLRTRWNQEKTITAEVK